jgi:site-specific DNA recombinase
LLSGLLKCGHCGSGYADKRGAFLRCSQLIETGLCDNRRTIGLAAIEHCVLEGIEKHLGAPDLIAEYVREFHRAWRELRDTTGIRRRELTRKLAETEARIKKTVEALIDGIPSRALKERLAELERERDVAELAIAELSPPPLEIHPNAAESYRQKVQNLKAAIDKADAMRGIRELVEKIVIRPTAPYKAVHIEIHGTFAALGQNAEGTCAQKSMGVVVAGVGFEPTTLSLRAWRCESSSRDFAIAAVD